MAKATNCTKCHVLLTSETQSDGIRRANRALCNSCERERKRVYEPRYRERNIQRGRQNRAEKAKLRPPRPTLEQRFMQKVEIRVGSECWWWNGAVSNWGRYGVFNAGGKTMLAHRFSMLHFNKIDPGSLFVCHTCDEHLCVNPEHLFVGTQQDNTDDMIRKKRNSREQEAVNRALNAKRVARRVLCESQVIEIVRRVNAGEHPKTIAPDYGVGVTAITSIMNGNTWSHLTGFVCRRHHWKFSDSGVDPTLISL